MTWCPATYFRVAGGHRCALQKSAAWAADKASRTVRNRPLSGSASRRNPVQPKEMRTIGAPMESTASRRGMAPDDFQSPATGVNQLATTMSALANNEWIGAEYGRGELAFHSSETNGLVLTRQSRNTSWPISYGRRFAQTEREGVARNGRPRGTRRAAMAGRRLRRLKARREDPCSVVRCGAGERRAEHGEMACAGQACGSVQSRGSAIGFHLHPSIRSFNF